MATSATIRHVAREAGVSVATVSRVMNESRLVAERTRLQVLDAARRLAYVPHSGARSLITNRTSTIGVLLPDLYGEFFSEVIRGIDETARKHGYHVLISSSHADNSDVDAVLRSMRGRVDGLILMVPEVRVPAAIALLPEGFPLVFVNCSDESGRHDAIAVANYDGAWAMTRHLIARGHRRIAMITGTRRNLDAAERLRGYRAALRDAGIAPDATLELGGDFSEASGFAAATQLAGRRERPSAVFAANDSMAIGALSAFRAAGLRVPEDIAVAGFDDIPMARFVDPPLSSVHFDISALGASATTRLLDAMHRPESHEVSCGILPTTLVVRRSCGG
jgi:LacI family transcriptional regulator